MSKPQKLNFYFKLFISLTLLLFQISQVSSQEPTTRCASTCPICKEICNEIGGAGYKCGVVRIGGPVSFCNCVTGETLTPVEPCKEESDGGSTTEQPTTESPAMAPTTTDQSEDSTTLQPDGGAVTAVTEQPPGSTTEQQGVRPAVATTGCASSCPNCKEICNEIGGSGYKCGVVRIGGPVSHCNCVTGDTLTPVEPCKEESVGGSTSEQATTEPPTMAPVMEPIVTEQSEASATLQPDGSAATEQPLLLGSATEQKGTPPALPASACASSCPNCKSMCDDIGAAGYKCALEVIGGPVKNCQCVTGDNPTFIPPCKKKPTTAVPVTEPPTMESTTRPPSTTSTTRPPTTISSTLKPSKVDRCSSATSVHLKATSLGAFVFGFLVLANFLC